MLGAAYLLGASSKQLELVYKNESQKLVPWEASPNKIDEGNWRDHFNDKRSIHTVFACDDREADQL